MDFFLAREGVHLIELVSFVLFLFIFRKICTRRAHVGLRIGRIPLGRILGSVRSGDRCAFFCGSTRVSVGHGIAMRTGGRHVSIVLSGVLPSYGYMIRGEGVVLIPNTRGRGAPGSGATGAGRVANAIASAQNRALVNMGMAMLKAAANIVAGVSKGCSLGIPTNGSLGFSCINCVTRAMGMNSGSIVSVMLRRGDGTLSRIIMINCTIRGGIGLSNSMTAISAGTVRSHPMLGVKRTLRNTITGLGMSINSNRTSSSPSCGVHNAASLGKNSPLIIVSNIISADSRLGHVGPISVTGVSMLGSTTSSTVCNSHTTFNIVLIAAGSNDGRGLAIGCGGGFMLHAGAHVPRVVASPCLITAAQGAVTCP